MRRLDVSAVGLAVMTMMGCQDPTQIRLEVTTNAVCADVAGTVIAVGPPGELEDDALAVAKTVTCTATAQGADIGSLVLVPSDADDAAVGVKVAMAVGGNVDECLKPPYSADCIIARRSLRYIPGTPLTLPVHMNVNCLGVFCNALSTCVNGACVDAAVDPYDCIDPEGCEPAGGGGGAGGAPPGCGTPIDRLTVVAPGDGKTRSPVAVAADPETCQWGIVWNEAPSELCFQQVGADGVLVGERWCDDRSNPYDDVAVAPLGGGAFVSAGWSSVLQTALLAIPGPVPGNVVEQVPSAVGGALSFHDGQLVMLNEHADWQLRYRTYQGAGLDFLGEIAIDGTTGVGADLAWVGGDLAVGWNNDGASMIRRFTHGSDGSGTTAHFIEPVLSEVVVATHEPTGLVGVAALDTGAAVELDTFDLDGSRTYGDGGNDYFDDTTSIGLTGTTSGWVLSFIQDGKGWLTSYDESAHAVTIMAEVAADAVSLDVAAIGDQLGVAWSDTQHDVHLRLLDADLAALQ